VVSGDGYRVTQFECVHAWDGAPPSRLGAVFGMIKAQARPCSRRQAAAGE
jgi:hypothetical protein